jgi:carotenoid cleavage dioxygenase
MASNGILKVDRRTALRTLAAAGAFAAGASAARLAWAGSAPADEGVRFDAAVARWPRLAPFKGIDDGDPARSDLSCDALTIEGRWPAELRGRFYRNGPAIFERAGQRYHHWFDGDGMVQRFAFTDRGVSHLGRLVETSKLKADRAAHRFVVRAFGTPFEGDAPIQGPDSLNAANTNAIEHAGRVLALWEGGSAYALDARDLSTIGPVTWKEGYEQVPFSAHPKLDPRGGGLWNIGTFADRIVVWQIDAAGRLASVQVRSSPYPGGLAHDVAMTERFLVLPLPPVKMNYAAIAAGATPAEAFVFERDEPLRVLVMHKADATDARLFELPPRMVFHVGHASETRDGEIELGFVAALDHDFLVHGATELVAGRPDVQAGSTLHVARLNLASGRARLESHPGAIEFPRVDPRRLGGATRYLASVARWRPDVEARGGLFHGVQLRDLATGRVDRYDYGADAVVEEHILVPKPHRPGELDAWLVGTVFDARRGRTSVHVLEARSVAAGPVASASLPYALPFGFHGNFSARAA